MPVTQTNMQLCFSFFDMFRLIVVVFIVTRLLLMSLLYNMDMADTMVATKREPGPSFSSNDCCCWSIDGNQEIQK